MVSVPSRPAHKSSTLGQPGRQRRCPCATSSIDWVIHFTYVDNSNVFIEGRRLSAVVRGLAPNVAVAMRDGIFDSKWTYDFGRLYELICPETEQVGRALMVGSRPPPNDSIWQRASAAQFEVEVFDRNIANREKQVDTRLTTALVADGFKYMAQRVPDVVAVVVAGDGDFAPPIRELNELEVVTRVVFWEHATSRELKDAAQEFVPLDPYLGALTLS